MSAPEVVIGYVAATDRAHPPGLGDHEPLAARSTTRSATPSGSPCSTTSPTAASSGAPAAAPAATRWPPSTCTPPRPRRCGTRSPRRSCACGSSGTTRSQGEFFQVPTPHNILPKPYGNGHPPIWVGCGNPATFTKAGELGIGAIAFNFEPIYNLKGRIDAYKEGIANCTEPIGQFVNDNVMMTNAVICVADSRPGPRDRHVRGPRLPQHDGEPLPRHDAEAARCGDLARRRPSAIPDEATLDWLIEDGYLLCGTPDEVNEQIAKYQEVGCDQLVFGIPNEGFEHDEVLEMIELFGDKVIPELRHRPGAPHHPHARRPRSASTPTSPNPMPEGLDVSRSSPRTPSSPWPS